MRALHLLFAVTLAAHAVPLPEEFFGFRIARQEACPTGQNRRLHAARRQQLRSSASATSAPPPTAILSSSSRSAPPRICAISTASNPWSASSTSSPAPPPTPNATRSSRGQGRRIHHQRHPLHRDRRRKWWSSLSIVSPPTSRPPPAGSSITSCFSWSLPQPRWPDHRHRLVQQESRHAQRSQSHPRALSSLHRPR